MNIMRTTSGISYGRGRNAYILKAERCIPSGLGGKGSSIRRDTRSEVLGSTSSSSAIDMDSVHNNDPHGERPYYSFYDSRSHPDLVNQPLEPSRWFPGIDDARESMEIARQPHLPPTETKDIDISDAERALPSSCQPVRHYNEGSNLNQQRPGPAETASYLDPPSAVSVDYAYDTAQMMPRRDDLEWNGVYLGSMGHISVDPRLGLLSAASANAGDPSVGPSYFTQVDTDKETDADSGPQTTAQGRTMSERYWAWRQGQIAQSHRDRRGEEDLRRRRVRSLDSRDLYLLSPSSHSRGGTTTELDSLSEVKTANKDDDPLPLPPVCQAFDPHRLPSHLELAMSNFAQYHLRRRSDSTITPSDEQGSLANREGSAHDEDSPMHE